MPKIFCVILDDFSTQITRSDIDDALLDKVFDKRRTHLHAQGF